jgi:hypothetical protein
LRNQLDAWETAGLRLPDGFAERHRLAMRRFIEATTSQHEPEFAAEAANASIDAGIAAAEQLAAAHVEQSLAVLQQQSPQLGDMLGGALMRRPLSRQETQWMVTAFNAVQTAFTWRDVEPNEGQRDWSLPDMQIVWHLEQKVKVALGPLLDLREHALPDWLLLFADDFDHLASAVSRYVESVARRYRGAPHFWNAAAGFHLAQPSFLTEEQRLRLAVGAVEAVRSGDSRTPVIITFDQPWAEYLAHHTFDLSPLHIADAMLRAELGLAGIGLEINYGYWPHGTPARDLLEISRQIDRWASLGLPLMIFLSVPSEVTDDPRARVGAKPLSIGEADPPTPDGQARVAKRLIELLLAKPSVHGVIWTQTCDGAPHDYANAGWTDAVGRPKPLLDTLTQIRRSRLL